MDKSNFTKTVICSYKDLKQHVLQAEYRSSAPLLTADEIVERQASNRPIDVSSVPPDPNQLYTVDLSYKSVFKDSPLAVGSYILSKSKLRNMRAIEFLKNYLIESFWTTSYCDTDSFVIFLARDSMDECVKPELLKSWLTTEKDKWFVPEVCNECKKAFIDGHYDDIKKLFLNVPWTQNKCCHLYQIFHTKSPGLLKREFDSHRFIALNAKSYMMESEDGQKRKFGAKGVKREIAKTFTYNTYAECTDQLFVKNKGIRCKQGAMFTYELNKVGLTKFDKKRYSYPDGTSENVHL